MRETKTVIIPSFEACKNRDFGKHYLITEWSAAKADRWIEEITFALNQGAGAIPMDVRGIGWEGIAIMGVNTFLRGNVSSKEMIPLLDQLLECVQIIRDPKGAPKYATPIVSDDDIEEVATRWWLRSEVVSVHVNFSPAAALSKLISSIFTPANS